MLPPSTFGIPSPGLSGSIPGNQPQKPLTVSNEITPPKCFGTDYFGKWNASGMTYESMKIDRPEYQTKCANCPLFSKCYELNHIRILKIKH